jgi:hypothetical protein
MALLSSQSLHRIRSGIACCQFRFLRVTFIRIGKYLLLETILEFKLCIVREGRVVRWEGSQICGNRRYMAFYAKVILEGIEGEPLGKEYAQQYSARKLELDYPGNLSPTNANRERPVNFLDPEACSASEVKFIVSFCHDFSQTLCQ